MNRIINNPVDVIEPSHLGQMFLDQDSNTFYQARGLTASDWKLVTPLELTGSFVKIYDFLLGPMIPGANNPQEPNIVERYADAEAVRKTMEMDGVRVIQAFHWQTAKFATVMMVRLRLDRLEGLSLFIGFAPRATAHTMPDGVGFEINDGMLSFANRWQRKIMIDEIVLLRIELFPTVKTWMASAYVNDESVAISGVFGCPSNPIVASFLRGAGTRMVAPGYAQALKRNLERSGPPTINPAILAAPIGARRAMS